MNYSNLIKKTKNVESNRRRRPQGNQNALLSSFQSNGHDNRVLSLFGPVSAETVQHLVHAIHSYNQFDEEQENVLTHYERKPIILLINSPGGEVETGLSLVTTILNSQTPVITYSLGAVMSMAFIIYVSGHIRLATKESVFMYHQISGGSYGFLESVKEDIEYMNVLEDMMSNIIHDNTYLSLDKLNSINKSKTNWYMKHEEAKGYGIFDVLVKEEEEGLHQYLKPKELSDERDPDLFVIRKNKIKVLQDKQDAKQEAKDAKRKSPKDPKTKNEESDVVVKPKRITKPKTTKTTRKSTTTTK